MVMLRHTDLAGFLSEGRTMTLNRTEQGSTKVRTAYQAPVLRVHGTFQALTQMRTCAKGYNDGTSAGCKNSAKKS
jgi:hypothetical protein